MRTKSESRVIPLIVVGPLPPPTHGVTISTALVLKNLAVTQSVQGGSPRHERPARSRKSWRVGLKNVFIGLRSTLRLTRLLLRPASGVLYLPLSQNRAAFIRDAIFINLAYLRGWKTAVHLRGGEFDLFYGSCGRSYRLLIRQTLRRITSIAVLGTNLVGMFEGLVEPSKIRVVTNGTPNIRVSPGRRCDRILFMANLLRRKGVVETVEAALLVIGRHRTAHFIFAGTWEDQELASRLETMAAATAGRISFCASVSGREKDKLLSEAGIFVFPPREPEGQPRAVLEAMAAGLPVITTDRGALSETVIDQENGFVLPNPVPDQIATRILYLLAHPGRQARMGTLSKDRHALHYTQEQADVALAAWLRDVSKGGRAQVPRTPTGLVPDGRSLAQR